MLINDYHEAQFREIGGITGLLDPTNKEKVKKMYYLSNIEKAKRLVPASNLLIYDIKDGYEPLCEFLKVPVPENKEVPHLCDRQQLDTVYAISESGAKREVLMMVIVPIAALTTAAVIIYKKLKWTKFQWTFYVFFYYAAC